MKLPLAAAAAAVAALLAAAPAHAATFTVNRTDDVDVCDGSSCSLRGAVNLAARTGGTDTIVVLRGTYLVTSPLRIADNVVIRGAGARDTIIDGRGQVHAVDVVQGSVIITSMTVRNGGGAGAITFGANVHNGPGATLTLDHVRLTGGQASSGGGIANEGGTLSIDHSLIDGNRALTGGG